MNLPFQKRKPETEVKEVDDCVEAEADAGGELDGSSENVAPPPAKKKPKGGQLTIIAALKVTL